MQVSSEGHAAVVNSADLSALVAAGWTVPSSSSTPLALVAPADYLNARVATYGGTIRLRALFHTQDADSLPSIQVVLQVLDVFKCISD